jgi:hypothetical protein
VVERLHPRRLLERFLRLSLSARILTLTIGGIAGGVLLLATGIALVQLVGALLVLLGLLMARCGASLPAAWWSDPAAQLPDVRVQLRRVVPGWAWDVPAVALLLIAAIWLVRRVLAAEGLSTGALEDLAKGGVGLALLAALLLWRADGIASRWLHRAGRRFLVQDPEPLPDDASS